MRAGRVPQKMRIDPSLDAGRGRAPLDELPESHAAHRLPKPVEEDAILAAVHGDLRAAPLEIGGDRGPGRPADWHQPFLVALANDASDPFLEVQHRDRETGDL